MAVDSSHRVGGMSLKQISLIALTIQTSAHILIMHYSRVMPPVDGQRYFSSTAVFLNEVVKLTVSLTMALYGIATNPKTPDTSTAAGLFGELGREVFTGDSWKVAIPAMMYTLQNTLQYVAISNLDVATFQVTNQLKILITAVLSVIFLGRRLGGRKWLALVLLLVGVAVVQIPSGSSHSAVLSIKDLRGGMAFHEARSIWDLKMAGNKAAGQLSKRSATYEGIDEDFQAANPEINATHGLIAIVLASILSGLNSLYFEKGLNEPRNENATSAWVRQVQMSFYSMWPALFLGVLFKDGEHIAKTGFFTGYNWAVWTAIILQAVGGILVGFVINISSNSVKNVAASIAIPTSFVGSVLFDFKISSFYFLGTPIVLFATYLFNANTQDESKPKPPPINIVDAEKHDGAYFDLESVVAPAKSPLRSSHAEALSTSRPGTPTYERVPHRMKSSDFLKMSKRDS